MRFPLDLGQGDVTTSQAEWIPGQVDLDFADIPTPTLAVYPLPDHFAEKLHAYRKPRENPSRVKDLVDMLLLIDMGLQAMPQLRGAIKATFERYDTHPLPLTLAAPPESWEAPFAALAEEVGQATSSIHEAH